MTFWYNPISLQSHSPSITMIQRPVFVIDGIKITKFCKPKRNRKIFGSVRISELCLQACNCHERFQIIITHRLYVYVCLADNELSELFCYYFCTTSVFDTSDR